MRPNLLRRRISWVAGLSAAGVAVLVVLSPIAGASTLIRPPFKGVFAPYKLLSSLGCGKTKVLAPPSFNFSTGVGGVGDAFAKSTVCGPSFGGVGSSSSQSLQFNPGIEVKFHVPNGYHSVVPKLTMTWSFRLAYTNGSGCPSPQPFALSYTNATPNASYAYWDNYSGSQSFCESFMTVFAEMDVLGMADLTTGTVIPLTSGCSACTILENSSYSYNDSGWEFYNFTTYSNGNWSYVSGVNSFNSSSASPTVVTGSGSMRIPMEFNYTFQRSDTYALFLFPLVDVYTTVSGYVGGASQGTLNTETLGNGLVLSAVVVR